VDELTPGTRKVFTVLGRQVLVMNIDGQYFAIDNVCPHAKGDLSKGRVEHGTITCLNHGACFDLKTGEVRIDMLDDDLRESIDVDNLPFGPVQVFAVTMENGEIMVVL
jgi:nitrite reductase/ring-hydroxylating ferredoxin subunit